MKLLLTVYCDPFVQVFAIRQHDCHAQVTTPQSRLCMFQQLVLVRSLRDILLGLEGFVSTVSTVCQIEKRKENSVINTDTDVMTEHEKSQFLRDGSAEQVELLVISAICRNQSNRTVGL